MITDSPWYISAAAVRMYAEILGICQDSGYASKHFGGYNFDACQDELIDIVRVAKFVENRQDGLLEYRGDVPLESRRDLRSTEHRLVLLVSTARRDEGPLHQLVGVYLRGVRRTPEREAR